MTPVGAVISLFPSGCGRKNPCVEPDYNASLWTSTLDNTYNYAVNVNTGTYAQPGRAGGAEYSEITETALRAACVLDVVGDEEDQSDGVFPTTNNCLMMLTIVPGVDFHFFRRDSDGFWSHKPGPRTPTNLDNSGNVITDPRTADIAPYKFARFLSACDRKVGIN